MTKQVEICPEYRDALRALGLISFDDFMRIDGVRTSRHRHRETLAIGLPGGASLQTFYLKRVFKVPLRHSLNGDMSRSHPRNEWHICREFAKLGIPAMEAVAVGESSRWGLPRRAFVLVKAVPTEWTLENWIVPGYPRPAILELHARQRLFFELGCLLRRIVDAGFFWPDTSAKHIFAQPKAGQANQETNWNFCLIDLERTRRITPAQIDKSLNEMIERLCLSLIPMTWDPKDVQRFADGLRIKSNSLTSQAAQSAMLPRLPDDYVHSKSTRMIQGDAMNVDEHSVELLRTLGISSFEDAFRFRGEDLHKSGLAEHRERIRIPVTRPDATRSHLFLKRYFQPPLREQWHRILDVGTKRSTAAREEYFIKRLTQAGIPTMRLAAFGQQMAGPIEKRSFSITLEVPGESLEKLTDRIRANPSVSPCFEQRRDTIQQVARVVALLHRNRMFHRDLYLCHIFVHYCTNGLAHIRLIDLARMIRRKRFNTRWIIKDLAALDYSAPPGVVTRADRIRFLYDYLPDSASLPGAFRKRTARRIIKQVQNRTRRMAKHDVNRNARLGKQSQGKSTGLIQR